MRAALAGAVAALLVTSLSVTAVAAKSPPAAPVQFTRMDLADGGAAGTARSSGGAIVLAASGLAAGSYDDPYDSPDRGPIAYASGSWTSDWATAPFAIDELVASWNADTPAGTWIRIEMQARGTGRETKWYTMGIWAAGDVDVHRTSVSGQGDADGSIAIDTFIRAKKAPALDSYRLRVALYRASGTASPTVRLLAAMVSAATKYENPSPFSGAGADNAVPRYSQEVHTGEFPEYDGGGEAWCSPTSTAMILAYWHAGPTAAELAAFPGAGYTDPQVDHAARYVYDWNYQGAGNWPDNAAYAARFGMTAFVTRLRSLGEAQRFIDAGIPLVASIQGSLPGFFFKKTNGHLLVIRGFTPSGDVIANDPAVPTDADVTKVYGRRDFEDVWLGGSGGIVYVIAPTGRALPANVPGLPANW